MTESVISRRPLIGVLAVQGAFAEHEQVLDELGAQCVELRDAADCELPLDGLVLPGGESTVQRKLLHELDMFEPLKAKIDAGMPVLGTCAGAILLASQVEGGLPCFGSMPMTVVRNAYGRQLASFHARERFSDIGEVPMTFIRAPKIQAVGFSVEPLAFCKGDIVAACYGSQIVCTFHPELDEDPSIHKLFLDCCRRYKAGIK